MKFKWRAPKKKTAIQGTLRRNPDGSRTYDCNVTVRMFARYYDQFTDAEVEAFDRLYNEFKRVPTLENDHAARKYFIETAMRYACPEAESVQVEGTPRDTFSLYLQQKA